MQFQIGLPGIHITCFPSEDFVTWIWVIMYEKEFNLGLAFFKF